MINDELATKKDLKNLEQKMNQKIEKSEERIVRHFYVVAEDLFEKLSGAN